MKLDKKKTELVKQKQLLNYQIEQYLAENVYRFKGDKGDRGDDGQTIKGDKGEKGIDGLHGKTPIKGQDYFTTEDIQELKSLIGKPLEIETEKVLNKVEELEKKAITEIKAVDIARKLETLTGDKRLDASAIKNLSKYISTYILTSKSGGTGGASKFTDLSDVPNSYTGQQGKFVQVKNDETGLQFVDSSSSVAWGAITGDIEDQTDLQDQFDTKQDVLAKADSLTDGYLAKEDFSTFNAKQDALGFVAENTANKDTTTTLGTSDVKYPSQMAVKTYVDTGLSGKQPTGDYATNTDLGNKVDKVSGKGLSTNDLTNTLKENYDKAYNFPVDINRYGFLNRTETTISFDNIDTFTLTSIGANWSYYRTGVRYTITGNKTIQLASPMVDSTEYFIYIDSIDGSLSVSTSSWTLNDTKIPVATVYWDSTLTPKFILSDERHTCLIDRAFHREHHFTDGTEVQSAGTVSGLVANSSTPADKTFGITGTTIFDEDLAFSLATLTDPDGATPTYYILYRTSANTYKWLLSDMPFKYSGATAPYGYIEYDNNGTSTPVSTNNRFVNTYIFVSNSVANNEANPEISTSATRYFIMQGTNFYASALLAQAEKFQAFAGMPVAEGVAIYQLTWSNGGIANTVKGRCQFVSIQNISTNITSSSSTPLTIHNNLAGLDGGTTNEYYHLTSAEYTVVQNTSGTNTGDQDLSTLMPKSGGSFTGAVEFNTEATFDAIVDNGNSGTSKTIDWTTGNKQKITTTGSCTLTFTAPSGVCNLVLEVVHEASATAYTYTYPANVKWAGGTKPTTSNTSGAIDIISFFYDGTNYFGVGSLLFS